ncbi:MAG: cupin domain-containing protein [Gaiella sp.]
MAAYTIKHIDEMEHPWPNWILARKALGVESFGLNVAELQPGEQITEHDEIDRDQEEVFVTLGGSPTMIVEGTEHPMPEGTCVRLDPQPKRYIVNNGATTARVLIISAPRTSGYQAMEWA